MGWAPVRTKTARVGCALLALILLASWPFEAWASSQVQALSDPGRDAFNPQVAVDADGDAVVVWHRFDGTNWRVQARRRSAAGALSAVQSLSDPGQDAFEPQVAVDADGDAVVVWRRFDGANWRVQARRRSATGALSAVQTLSDPGQDAFEPQVAVDADGDAVVVWRRFFGTSWRVQARAQARSGSLRVVNTLSDPASASDLVPPQVAIDRDGDAVVVWARSDGTNRRVEAAAMSAV
jgi:hypothetical protein